MFYDATDDHLFVGGPKDGQLLPAPPPHDGRIREYIRFPVFDDRQLLTMADLSLLSAAPMGPPSFTVVSYRASRFVHPALGQEVVIYYLADDGPPSVEMIEKYEPFNIFVCMEDWIRHRRMRIAGLLDLAGRVFAHNITVLHCRHEAARFLRFYERRFKAGAVPSLFL